MWHLNMDLSGLWCSSEVDCSSSETLGSVIVGGISWAT